MVVDAKMQFTTLLGNEKNQCASRALGLDWPIVWSGPRPWVFWGPFWRPDRMVWSQNGSVSKVFFRPDCSVQSNLYRKMGTVSETGPYGLCQERSRSDWTVWSSLDQMKNYRNVSK